ncbi:MAG TPA: NAD(+) kinase, partial [Clostridiaceae bacterium]|nr:NAD(+) kinase [Clostridiaceae bacterium]HBG37691.1 NAD(+) kinase [Clostridiaceae bacterium]HBX48516.1 NAD(+) kinase [Clostridiaceae bacterium]HCL51307.1 NAD(+) kinase [Clostridiaceae bacterium]
MINAGIIVNMDKSGSLELTKEMVEWFESNGNNVLLMEQTAISINRQDIGYAKIDLYKKSDILFVIGGDGTLLRVAREVAAIGIPILGINMGHLGFIAEVEVKDIFSSLRKVL